MRSLPVCREICLHAVGARGIDGVLELAPRCCGHLRAVPQEPDPGIARQPSAQRVAVGLEREPARGRERVHRDVAAARAQRVEHGLTARLAVDQDVRADVPERALVRHQPQRHPPPDADPDLVRVEPADRHDGPLPAQLVPRAHVALGRMVDVAVGRRQEPDDVAPALDRLAGVVHEAPQLEPLDAVKVAERDPAPLEQLRSLRERMRREAEAALCLDRLAHLGGRAPDLLDDRVDPEREVVVLVRRHLLADQQQHVRRASPPGRGRARRACRGR